MKRNTVESTRLSRSAARGGSRTRRTARRALARIARLALPAAVLMTLTGAHAAAPLPFDAAQLQANRLLARMTLAEKVALIRGVEEPASSNQGQAGYLPGVPRLGIAPIRMADGPPGVLTRLPSQAFTATMGLAATFSRPDAQRNGEAIAREAKRLGIEVVLEPFINIDRDITFGRGFNTFGEDPFLTGMLGAAQITGTQSQGVMAQAKHYIGYDTNAHSVVIDPQTLHEVYLAPFDAAIHAGVSSIMCSYNKINGGFACGNHETLTDILRGEMGFKGFVTSDWGAVHSNLDLNAGLDMEMPGVLPSNSPFASFMYAYFDLDPTIAGPMRPNFDTLATVFQGGMPEEPKRGAVDFSLEFPADPAPQNLARALSQRKVTMARVTEAARRVLTQLIRFRLLNAQAAQPVPASGPTPENAQVGLQTSLDAAVLLKNEGVLPLGPKALRNVALIGPGAGQTVAVGRPTERALGFAQGRVSPLLAMQKALAGQTGVNLTYAVEDDMEGVPVPAAAWSHDAGAGLMRAGAAGCGQVDAALNFTKENGAALPANGACTWSAMLDIPQAGDYGLNLGVLGARAVIEVDGKRATGSSSLQGSLHGDTVQANQDNLVPTHDGLNNLRVRLALTQGKHLIKVSLTPDTSNDVEQVRLSWVTPEQRAAEHQRAIDAARNADTAVVFVWSRGVPVFGLPADQNALVEEIAAVNPNTIVVLNASQPVALPWLDKVKGLVQMWWPGDEGGEATADILLGKVSPAGRLPFTWANKLTDYPATDPAFPERSSKGVGGDTRFSEGVDVGYRWFERRGIEPLFPFGFGLSYSRFAYDKLRVTKAADGGLDIHFTVANVGGVDSDEVPQVYLGAPAVTASTHDAQFAPKTLSGFTRVHLQAGESRPVDVHVPLRQLQYWSAEKHAWRTVTAGRQIYVGASSRDLRLNAPIAMR